MSKNETKKDFNKTVKNGERLPLVTVNGQKYPFKLSGVPFGQNPNNPTFTKLHLAQTQEHFHPIGTGLPEGFYIDIIAEANPETMARIFIENLTLVGGTYGWNNREKYQPDHRKDIVEHMADKETKIYRFFDNGEQVGFCTLSGIKPDWEPKAYQKGLNKFTAVNLFAKQEHIKDWPRPIEIYKFGILPSKVGKKYGSIFLSALTERIFEEGNYNIIYLDTRDTNPVGAEEFYAGLGYRSFYKETLPNDLVKPVVWPPVLTSEATQNIKNRRQGLNFEL